MPPTRAYLPSSERRDKTVETVVSICAEEDPSSITTARIADRMQVTQGALFRHFPSKEAIWEAVVNWVANSILERLEHATALGDTPLDSLRRLYDAHIDFIVQHPGVPRLLMGQLQHHRITPAKKLVHTFMLQYRERVAELLAAARTSGQLRQSLDVEAAATQFIGMIQGLVMQSLVAGDIRKLAGQAPGSFEIFCHGICAGTGEVSC